MRAVTHLQRDPDGLAPETAAAQARAWRAEIERLCARLRAPLPKPVQMGDVDAWIEALAFTPKCRHGNRHCVADLLYVHVRANGKRLWCMKLRRKVDGQTRILDETLGEWPRMKFRDALAARDEAVAAFEAGLEWFKCEI